MSAEHPAASEHLIRPWPDSVPKRGLTRQFAAAFREGFDADPVATFGAREINGVLIVAAVGDAARDLEVFVKVRLGGCVERLEAERDA